MPPAFGVMAGWTRNRTKFSGMSGKVYFHSGGSDFSPF
jgi:hypothetical protein